MPSQQSVPTLTFSEEQQQSVLTELGRVLASDSFRSSRRFSMMLEHCVRLTLTGDLERLRERQLGVDVFGREPGYETSSDPVVRMAAGEVRKRLAQHYAALLDDPPVRISLPLGGYSVEFRFVVPAIPSRPEDDRRPPVPPGSLNAAEPLTPPMAARHVLPRSLVYWIAGSMILLAMLLGLRPWKPPAPSPFLSGLNLPGGTIALVGQLPQNEAAGPNPLPLSQDIFRSDDAVTIEGATSAVAVCSELARRGGSCVLREAARVKLSDLQHRPVVLFGAYNNSWALRMTQELPFHFGPLECKCILDGSKQQPVATVDFSLPREKIFLDYSVVARFESRVSDGPVLAVAGVGPMSTQAAAAFVSSDEGRTETLRVAPKGWKDGNVELVLGTEVVGGVPGHTKIVRSAFW